MKFSIIIPTLNRWDLLNKCLKSIKDNTDLTDGEVIVVSNGCTDFTPFTFYTQYRSSQSNNKISHVTLASSFRLPQSS